MHVRALTSSFALATLLASPAAAQSVVFDDSTPYDAVPGLTSFETNFDELGSMQVDWSFVGGGGGSAVWGDLGDYLGLVNVWGVSEGDFFLGGLGGTDTFDNSWHLIGNDIASFTIYAALGNSVFDVVGSPETSPGSSSGQEFDYQCAGVFFFVPFCFQAGTDYWNTTVTYSNPVGINGASPAGDLYATMTVAFGNGFNADRSCFQWPSNCNYAQFYQDMDNAPADGSIGTPQETVPEPATMTLLATGLAGMAAARKRKRSQS